MQQARNTSTQASSNAKATAIASGKNKQISEAVVDAPERQPADQAGVERDRRRVTTSSNPPTVRSAAAIPVDRPA
jgi:hypothetical protein